MCGDYVSLIAYRLLLLLFGGDVGIVLMCLRKLIMDEWVGKVEKGRCSTQ